MIVVPSDSVNMRLILPYKPLLAVTACGVTQVKLIVLAIAVPFNAPFSQRPGSKFLAWCELYCFVFLCFLQMVCHMSDKGSPAVITCEYLIALFNQTWQAVGYIAPSYMFFHQVFSPIMPTLGSGWTACKAERTDERKRSLALNNMAFFEMPELSIRSSQYGKRDEPTVQGLSMSNGHNFLYNLNGGSGKLHSH